MLIRFLRMLVAPQKHPPSNSLTEWGPLFLGVPYPVLRIMPKPPLHKACGKNHWFSEPCPGLAFLGDVKPVEPHPPVRITFGVTKSSPELEIVTTLENVTHGGVRSGSGRKKQHSTPAEKQKAWRAKKELPRQ